MEQEEGRGGGAWKLGRFVKLITVCNTSTIDALLSGCKGNGVTLKTAAAAAAAIVVVQFFYAKIQKNQNDFSCVGRLALTDIEFNQ